ncbi:CsgG/HfaB family protein [Roseisolibacter sp. H3M3-2]|uniref:CsgG/HfaB family protein n=1 Tax=Roseisolibacter sp. H3M3-2 TaxID=3031323 RepID=UPI0023DA1C93|nr:CsgG/HfaB family protein [Roseisolibacter sp. H3M3-2]MDF1504482.1 CsgG/HfaB family protein [Roseisolibacter sp. H3M3-2]
MPRPPRLLAAAALLVLAAPAHAQSSDRRPTVAVLPFEVSALKDRADFEPLNRGVAEMMVSTLAANPGVRVIERERIQKLLDEQTLGASGRVDAETAVRIGKLLGVHHMLTGLVMVDTKRQVRMTARSINTETGVIEYAESVSGKADDLLTLIDQLGNKVNTGLKLPPIPFRVNTPTGGGEAAQTRTASNAPAAAKPGGSFRAMMLMSRGLEKQDRGDTQGAIALYKNALQEDPGLDRARVRLASAERAPAP